MPIFLFYAMHVTPCKELKAQALVEFCDPAISRTIIGLLTICLLLWPIKVRAWPVKAAGESNPMTSRSETAANQTLSQLKGLGKSSLSTSSKLPLLVENREQLTLGTCIFDSNS